MVALSSHLVCVYVYAICFIWAKNILYLYLRFSNLFMFVIAPACVYCNINLDFYVLSCTSHCFWLRGWYRVVGKKFSCLLYLFWRISMVLLSRENGQRFNLKFSSLGIKCVMVLCGVHLYTHNLHLDIYFLKIYMILFFVVILKTFLKNPIVIWATTLCPVNSELIKFQLMTRVMSS